MIALLAQLFLTFFLIGMFTFGGGYAMLSLIQAEVVVKHAWLSESMFADIVAISQMTPGPIGINCATYVGYDVLTSSGAGHLMGIVGSLTATLAIMLPSFIIVLLLVRFYNRVKGSPMFEGVMSVIRPAVVGLIGAAAIVLMFKVDWNGLVPSLQVVEENFPDWKSWCLFAAAFLASFKFKVNPILLIVLSGVMGLLLY
ncbi:MAG: chromate transporter [Bacteroidales bacterium]|nr:chromate transporter [Bacteroidales bacterium]